ncbi:TetR/AcrR family transcriptional regulator [Kitasatospora sp. NPDC001539]|uniref:TetR/AcrR family transcriptional regulator n=1 Tax=Kitasatospora sp. NPDC001539 TaxID=3154384 RepID=UPI00331F195F
MFEKEPAASKPRRSPAVQRRGVERRRAILEAAEALLGEQGYEAATLKAIGDRAGIPIASVYHYFPDRHEVDAEIMRQHVRAMDALIAAALDKAEPRNLREAVDAVIDVLFDYFRRHRSCVELWFARAHGTLDEIIRAFDESQADLLWHLAIARKLLPLDTPQLVPRLAWVAGNQLFEVAFRTSPTGDDAVIDEARRLVTAYLSTYAPSSQRERG